LIDIDKSPTLELLRKELSDDVLAVKLFDMVEVSKELR
jgi:hypothetical protein